MELAELDYFQNEFYDDYGDEEEEIINDTIVKSGLLEFESDVEDEMEQKPLKRQKRQKVKASPPTSVASLKEGLASNDEDQNSADSNPALDGKSDETKRIQKVDGKKLSPQHCSDSNTDLDNSQDCTEYIISKTVKLEPLDDDTSSVENSEVLASGKSDSSVSEEIQENRSARWRTDSTPYKIKEEVVNIDADITFKQELEEENAYVARDVSPRPSNNEVESNEDQGEAASLVPYRLLESSDISVNKVNTPEEGTKKTITLRKYSCIKIIEQKGKLEMSDLVVTKRKTTLSQFRFKVASVDLTEVQIIFVCVKCSSVVKRYSDISTHPCYASVATPPTLECFYCSRFVVSSYDYIKDHFNGVVEYFRNNRRISAFQCFFGRCKFISPSSKCFALHFKLTHNDGKGHTKKTKSLIKQIFNCTQCQHVSSNATALHRHVEIYHPRPTVDNYQYHCHICSFKAVYKSSLKIHLNFAHKKEHLR